MPLISISRLQSLPQDDCQQALATIYEISQLNCALFDQAMVSRVYFATDLLRAQFLGIEEFGRYTLGWFAVLFVKNTQHATIISPKMTLAQNRVKIFALLVLESW